LHREGNDGRLHRLAVLVRGARRNPERRAGRQQRLSHLKALTGRHLPSRRFRRLVEIAVALEAQQFQLEDREPRAIARGARGHEVDDQLFAPLGDRETGHGLGSRPQRRQRVSTLAAGHEH
jgi:hypothetical protein